MAAAAALGAGAGGSVKNGSHRRGGKNGGRGVGDGGVALAAAIAYQRYRRWRRRGAASAKAASASAAAAWLAASRGSVGVAGGRLLHGMAYKRRADISIAGGACSMLQQRHPQRAWRRRLTAYQRRAMSVA
jgi:hypothetical protein